MQRGGAGGDAHCHQRRARSELTNSATGCWATTWAARSVGESANGSPKPADPLQSMGGEGTRMGTAHYQQHFATHASVRTVTLTCTGMARGGMTPIRTFMEPAIQLYPMRAECPVMGRYAYVGNNPCCSLMTLAGHCLPGISTILVFADCISAIARCRCSMRG